MAEESAGLCCPAGRSATLGQAGMASATRSSPSSRSPRAAASVYFVNDVMDAERDRQHPAKRLRPVASGRRPRSGRAGHGRSQSVCGCSREPRDRRADARRRHWHLRSYVASLQPWSEKHLPGIELAFVAFGFVLRALGGAVATHVPPSAWFLTVCSVGALMVAIGKRYTEPLSVLGQEAAAHRPGHALVPAPRTACRSACGHPGYWWPHTCSWAMSEHDDWMRGWRLASCVPLVLALIRFDRLTGLA